MLLHFNYGFYKAVRAYTAVLHVYERFKIDYMGNKTFLSFILIISKTTSSTLTKTTHEVVLFLQHCPNTAVSSEPNIFWIH